MRIGHLAAHIAATGPAAAQSPPDLFPKTGPTGGAWRQCNPQWFGRTADSASSGRATSGFADPGRPLRHRAHPHSTHL